jgi:hypothetical protein
MLRRLLLLPSLLLVAASLLRVLPMAIRGASLLTRKAVRLRCTLLRCPVLTQGCHTVKCTAVYAQPQVSAPVVIVSQNCTLYMDNRQQRAP